MKSLANYRSKIKLTQKQLAEETGFKKRRIKRNNLEEMDKRERAYRAYLIKKRNRGAETLKSS